VGDVLLKLGDAEQAIPQWKAAFLLDPANEKLAAKLKENGVDVDALRLEAEENAKKPKDAPQPGLSSTNAAAAEDDHPLFLTDPLSTLDEEPVEDDEELDPMDELPLPDEGFPADEDLPDEEPLDGQP